MLKIRLMRIGAKGRPFYRVVVVDERNKRNGAYLDLIGTYNPLTTPKEIKLDMKKIDEWLKKGAQKSDGLLRILKEAPQRHSKPKKESSAVSSQPSDVKAATEAPVEETTTEPVIPSNPPAGGEGSATSGDEPILEDSSPETQNDNTKEPHPEIEKVTEAIEKIKAGGKTETKEEAAA